MLRQISWRGFQCWLLALPTVALLSAGAVFYGHVTLAHEREVFCLALNDYHEARNQSPVGRIAVTDVVMERVWDERYPSTVCGVVFQPSQFSWTADELSDFPNLENPIERAAWEDAKELARDQLDANTRFQMVACVEGSMWYLRRGTTPAWSAKMELACSIGDHAFLKEPEEELPPISPSRPDGSVVVAQNQ